MPILLVLPVVVGICTFGALRSTGVDRRLWLACGGTLLLLWVWYVSALALMVLPD